MNVKSRSREVRDVGGVAGQQVVDADDRVAAVEQRLGQMRADEAGGSGDDDCVGMMGADAQYACLWKKPLSRVSHMIFRSSVTDQFSM